ncbi:hypothetical protein H5410_040040 [Solanum commersonii]|uniref:Uncharacterized protein n=1 Tax=Solanum commersonii TaxID=4109 RepID=A0A9J5XRC7_SOLCO|nr:hypothetical protein H5410_040040 [Solanum commersonii]
MSQQESSKRNKRAKNKTYAKPGSLSFLANKKRRLLTTNEIVQAIESEKGHLLKLIEQQPEAPQSEANRQPEEPLESKEPIKDQVQMNSVTPLTGEQLEEQGTLARNATLCPFDIFDWRSMDTKKDLWDYTKEKEKESVSAKELFVVTRTRKPDRLYKASNENTTSKIAEMEEIEKQMSTNGQSIDAFSAVMGPEHPGRLRLYGVGVTKTILKKKVDNSEPTLNATNDVVQQMQERMQKMEKQMEEQRRTMRQEVIADVVAQLQHAGLIDSNILAKIVRSFTKFKLRQTN